MKIYMVSLFHRATIKNTKKLKPALVASYNNRSGNGKGLFWFRHFINLSLTYLDIYLPTYSPGPTRGRIIFLQVTTNMVIEVTNVSQHLLNSSSTAVNYRTLQ